MARARAMARALEQPRRQGLIQTAPNRRGVQLATVRIPPGARWGAINGAGVSATNFGIVDARSAVTATAVVQRGTACAIRINPGCCENSCDDDVYVAVNRREGQRRGSRRLSTREARRVGDPLRLRGKHRGNPDQRRRRHERRRTIKVCSTTTAAESREHPSGACPG